MEVVYPAKTGRPRNLDIKKTAHPVTPEGGLNDTLSETDKVQGSHTDTLVGAKGLEPPTSAV